MGKESRQRVPIGRSWNRGTVKRRGPIAEEGGVRALMPGGVAFSGGFGGTVSDPGSGSIRWAARQSLMRLNRSEGAKRLLDMSLGAVLLALSAPVMLVVAVLIKLDSRGPVLFLQYRHGRHEELIRVIKFRTMHVDAGGSPAAITVQAKRGDRRITRIGRLLRRSSLDELPQLLNVLQGSMALVGPRPHPVDFLTTYRDSVTHYEARHHVKPGITGLAQVLGFRGETATLELMAKRVELDRLYGETWSVVLDLQILGRTLPACIRGIGAH